MPWVSALPMVPMFYANTLGLAIACPAVGANMVMPDDFDFNDAIQLGATGKVDKVQLRKNWLTMQGT
jgi:hypothetical protein